MPSIRGLGMGAGDALPGGRAAARPRVGGVSATWPAVGAARVRGAFGTAVALGVAAALSADVAASVPPAVQEAPAGRALAEALGCGACHSGVPGGETIRAVAPRLVEGEANIAPAYVFHYLQRPQAVRPDIGPARMPTYELAERERVALALFVANDPELRGVDDAMGAAMARHPDADRDLGAALFSSLNCAGCHVHPGVAPANAAPDLSLTPARARPEWLASYLADPVAIRPAGPVPGRGGQMPDFRLAPAEVSVLADYLLEGSGAAQSPGAEADPEWEPLPLSRFAMRKAEALLRDRWSCLGCHQLGDDGGRIGPRLDGISQRLRPPYVRALIQNPEHLAAGSVMPASLEQPDRLDLMASYLLRRDGAWKGSEAVAGLAALRLGNARTGSAAAAGTPDATGTGAAATATGAPAAAPTRSGADLYATHCAICHGVEGRGDGFNAPFLPVQPTAHADSAAMSLRPDDTLYDGIHAGGRILGKSHRMPAFGASLDDGEKRALVAYIRTLCRCQGPAWSRDGRPGR